MIRANFGFDEVCIYNKTQIIKNEEFKQLTDFKL